MCVCSFLSFFSFYLILDTIYLIKINKLLTHPKKCTTPSFCKLTKAKEEEENKNLEI